MHMRGWCLPGALVAVAAVAAEPLLHPVAGAGSAPAAPWAVVGLPDRKSVV